MLLEEAIQKFKNLQSEYGSLDGYRKDLNRYLCSYSEYMYQYEFWRLTDSQKSQFVSRLEMRFYYERYVPNSVRYIFWNKVRWLDFFKEYIHREWINVKSVDYNQFSNLIAPDKFYLAKPEEGSLGSGIFKFCKGDTSWDFFNKLKNEGYIVEELLYNNDALASFHPFSLNTIRITTLPNGDILGSFIRFGNNGNLVDNAHAGGIFAQIDPDTGIIVTDGIDTDGHTFKTHPYSNRVFKGFQIPHWDEITKLVYEMHRKVPMAPVVGWDICINKDDKIEVIEGNHFPDIDVLQSPAKRGIRVKLENQLSKAGLPSLKRYK